MGVDQCLNVDFVLDIQYPLEQMGICTPIRPKKLARFFANKWKFEQLGICTPIWSKKLARFFANKWEFKQMGICRVNTHTVTQNEKLIVLVLWLLVLH